MEYRYISHDGVTKTRVRNGRGRLVIGILSGFLGVAVSQSVAAQDALEEITVTGIRGSLQNSLNIKESAEGIVDAISAEDVGRFPDQNLAESLQRITGVQITRADGEGQHITIRGLPADFTRVQFNGRTLASPAMSANGNEGSRSFDFTIIPSSFVSELVVYKTSTADIEEGGISGTVQVKTIRPLELGHRVLSTSATAVREENSRSTDPKVTVLYSDVFGDGNFGVTLGAHYDERSPVSHNFVAFGAEVGVESGRNPPLDYNLDGDFDDTFRFHHESLFSEKSSELKRTTFLGTLQWQPTDSSDIWFETLYSEFDQKGHRNANDLRFTNVRGPGASVTASNVIPDPTGTTDGFLDFLQLDGVDHRARGNFREFENRLYSLALGGSQEFGKWTAEAEASLSDSEFLNTRIELSAIGRAHVSYDFRGLNFSDLPALVFADDYDPLDASNFRIVSFGGDFEAPREDTNTDLRLDLDRNLAWNLGNNLTVSGLEVGTRLSRREQFVGRQRLDVGGEALASLLGIPFDPTAIDGGFTAEGLMTLNSPRDHLSGYDGPTLWPTEWLDTDPRGLVNTLGMDQLIAAGVITQGGPTEYKVTEDVTAAYVRLNFEGFDRRLSGNLGLRYVYTDQQSDGFFPDVSTLEVSLGGIETFVESSNGSVTRSYSEVLPSFNMRYEIADDVIMRFAAARVTSRPTLQVLSPATFYDVNTRSITSNNPNVDPFLADQVDLSLEWYFGEAGFLSFAPFMKDIKSFVVSSTNQEQITFRDRESGETVTDTFTRFRPDNGRGTTMFGYEVNWIQPLDFLFQGLGFQANFTFVDAEDVQVQEGGPLVPLTGLSRTSYNLIGFYENDKFGMRLAYNERDDFVMDPSSFFGDGQFNTEYSQLDLSANYNVNDNISLYFEALNLTDEVRLIVNSFGLNRGLEDGGRRMTLGVHANF